ncbi:hypothetical protein B0T22DRAFT_165644 [Podospora appendiculata]|uniref:Uncharacterized protein n=1 Tax=Podospora appendiculata TaxID=314037 RepID=A0AAE0XAJ8_9PEZI|nr:hypothetical protein B0T22DRAFT_165644 [Podospora appendiculata]
MHQWLVAVRGQANQVAISSSLVCLLVSHIFASGLYTYMEVAQKLNHPKSAGRCFTGHRIPFRDFKSHVRSAPRGPKDRPEKDGKHHGFPSSSLVLPDAPNVNTGFLPACGSLTRLHET